MVQKIPILDGEEIPTNGIGRRVAYKQVNKRQESNK
jgi:hypothetical protein